MSDLRTDLHEVRILEFPVDVYQRALEAFEGLQREFALIAMRGADAHDLPDRLLRVVSAITEEYATIASERDKVRDEAMAAGLTVVPELVHRVPASMGAACVTVSRLIDEADEFCRSGDLLLTLASPPEAVVFRRWYLGEFTAQLNGEAPLPWSRVDPEALLADPCLRGTAPD